MFTLLITIKEGNLSRELEYIQKLLRVDSILNNNYRNITNVINREYDTPRLLNDRQIIINRLNQKVNLNNFYLILTLLVSISLIIIAIFQYRKRKTQKLILRVY